MLALQHITTGCNQSTHCTDWNAEGVLAYGAGSFVVLAGSGGNECEVSINKVFCSLHGHTKSVNCVRWTSCAGTSGGSNILISGSVDSMIIVWKNTGSKFTYEEDDVLRGHTGPVVCVDALSHDNGITLVSSSSDSTMKIWERSRSAAKFTLSQSESFNRGFVLSLSLVSLEGSLVLACGTEANKVEIFVKQVDKFKRVHSLAGHEDWVKDVHFISQGLGCLLASCSQDCFIRLWKFCRTEDAVPTDPDELTVSEKKFKACTREEVEVEYSISLESVLIGHEDWVNSVRWLTCSSPNNPLCLLSSSMDKTMVLWALEEESGMWTEKVRVGDVGGNSLGLYGAVFGPRGDCFIAHGYQGTFHLWKKISVDHWVPVPTISGHYGPVQDIAWEPSVGQYLVSVSSDQTTRVHAPWMLPGKEEDGELVWREVARPQIHGYDMQCVGMLSSIVMVTGADEKVLRAFHCPRNFVEGIKTISHISLQVGDVEFPQSATLPSLGLSNKAADFGIDSPISPSAAAVEQPSSKTHGAPTEDQLHSTLWPEIHKLYGHSYEIFCVACSPDGRYIASACIASKQEFASILVWEAGVWRQVQVLCHHTLTVTQLAFSHSSQLLLAVSRDRTWSLWKLIGTCALELRTATTKELTLQAKLDNKVFSQVHSRIIWACSWTHDDLLFATASRDKKVYFWSVTNDSGGCSVAFLKGLPFDSAVTAVDFAPGFVNDKYLLSIGLESGEIFLYYCKRLSESLDFSLVTSANKNISHVSAVKKLRWNPNPKQWLLASCSTDTSVRIFHFVF